MSYFLARQFIKATLSERAMSTRDAEVSKLALMIEKIKGFLVFVLYDPVQLKAFLKQEDEDDLYGDRNKAYIKANDFIVGSMTTMKLGKWGGKRKGKGYNAYEVKTVAAQHGWGPMMYDIAMTVCGALTSDRDVAVSTYARNVWQHYFENRDDVILLPFDDIDDPKTRTKFDDQMLHDPKIHDNPLNYAYALKHPLNIERLIRRHQNVEKEQGRHVSMMIAELAGDFFDDAYFKVSYENQYVTASYKPKMTRTTF